MKAIEFIKKFGWDFSVAFSNKGEQLIEARPHEIGRGFIDDLKTLVDAYELVQSYGGLDGSTKECIKLHCSDEPISKLKEAISLVEEVGECDEN